MVAARLGGDVHFLDLATGQPVRPAARHCGRYLWSLAAAKVEGRPVVLTAGSLGDPCGRGAVQVWDPMRGTPIGKPLVHPDLVRAVTIIKDDERPLAVTRTYNGTLSVWDLTEHKLIQQRPHFLISVFSNIAVTDVANRPTLVFGTQGAMPLS